MRRWLAIMFILVLATAAMVGCGRKPAPAPDQTQPSTQVTVTVVNTPEKAFVKGSAPPNVAKLEMKPTTTFIPASTIEVTLKNARWNQALPTAEQNQGWTYTSLSEKDTKVVYTQSGTAGLSSLSLVLPGVIIEPNAAVGDMTVTLGGTSGVTGDYVVGKIVEGIKVMADKTVVKVSALEQPAGNITINESIEYGFSDVGENGVLKLTLPNGINFSKNPSIFFDGKEIVSVKVDDGGRGKNYIQWKGQAITAGFSNRLEKIEIRDIYYDIDTRFTPKDINVEVSGQVITGLGGSTETIAVVSNASARSLASRAATFVVGSKSYTIDGEVKTMEVAPYKRDERLFLPLRHAANALAIGDNSVIWDQVNQAVTLIKGNSVVQVKVGSDEILVNGIQVTMDAKPEMFEDQVMLPIGWIAQAFGATVFWDEAKQSATLSY